MDLVWRHGADPRGLCLEVTESTMAEPDAVDVLREPQETGISLAIDDFGTGYSGFARLRDLDLDLDSTSSTDS